MKERHPDFNRAAFEQRLIGRLGAALRRAGQARISRLRDAALRRLTSRGYDQASAYRILDDCEGAAELALLQEQEADRGR